MLLPSKKSLFQDWCTTNKAFLKKYRQQRSSASSILSLALNPESLLSDSCPVVLPSLNELCQLGFGFFPSWSWTFSSTVDVGHRQTRQLPREVGGQIYKIAPLQSCRANGLLQIGSKQWMLGLHLEGEVQLLMPHVAPRSNYHLPYPFCGRSKPTNCIPWSSLSEKPN